MAKVTRQKQTNWLGLLLLTVIFASLCAEVQAQSNYYYTAPVADFPTTANPWTAVTSCSLSFTPGSTTENWLVMATGQVRSSGTGDPQEAHVRLRVGGTVEAEGGVNQSPANAESGFFMMHRIIGTTALQSIDVQAQDPFANSSTTTVEQCSITAFLVPSNADFQWTEVPGIIGNCPDTPDTTILTHSFTPSSAGDYLFVTSLVSFENPGGVGNRAWVTYPSGAEAPDFNVENAWTNERDARQSYVSMRKETLGASLQTLSMTCDGSTGTAPDDKSTILWAKAASFRVDAFDATYHDEDLPEVTAITSATWATHSTVTQTAPVASSEFLMLGTISGCTNSATGGPQHGMRFREDSTVQGDSVWGTTRDCSYLSGMHNSFQWVEPYTTASATTWDNQYQSTDGITNAQFAESAIHVLEFPSAAVVSNVSTGWLDNRTNAVFHNGSRFFLLYSKGGSDIFYKSSTDNVTWSGESTLIGGASTRFNLYLVDDGKFDMVYYGSATRTYVRTCTISGATITCGSASEVMASNHTEVAVARSGGDRIYVVAQFNSDFLRMFRADQTGDADTPTTWTQVVNDTGADPAYVGIVPYEGADKVLVVYQHDGGGTGNDGVRSMVLTSSGTEGEVVLNNFGNLPDFSSPVRISDTDFRIIVRPPAAAMEEWKFDASAWSQVDANIDPDGETDQDTPSLFYDRISGDLHAFSIDTGATPDQVERHKKPSGGSWETEVAADANPEAADTSRPITQIHESPYGSARTTPRVVVWSM
jgi:hypothetical protein